MPPPAIRARSAQRGSSRPVEFVIQTSGTYEQLQEYVDLMLERIRAYPGLESVETDLQLNMPEFRIEMDRAKVADLGIDVTVVGRTLETLLGGRQVTRFEQNGEQYDVMRAARGRGPRLAADAVDHLPALADGRNDPALQHRQGQGGGGAEGAQALQPAARGDDLGQPGAGLRAGRRARRSWRQTAREVLPETALTDVAGQSREFRAAGQSLALVFLLALGFIYLVLAAQFESFRDPLIILVTVPLSMTGALGALWLTGGTLNVFSQIGLVTLVGLITKHGILIVEFANQLQEQGRSRARRGHRGGRAAPAADPDDHRRHGAGRAAAGDRQRRRRGKPPADRLGDRRRHELRHAADAVRHPDGLQLPRAGARRQGCGGSRTSRTCAG